MEDCIFCSVAQGKLPATFLYQDNDCMVIRDIHPQAPIHWMVIPKKHVTDFTQADEKLLRMMCSLVNKVIRKEKLTGFRIVTNGGDAAYIAHFHIHVLGSVDKNRNL